MYPYPPYCPPYNVYPPLPPPPPPPPPPLPPMALLIARHFGPYGNGPVSPAGLHFLNCVAPRYVPCPPPYFMPPPPPPPAILPPPEPWHLARSYRVRYTHESPPGHVRGYDYDHVPRPRHRKLKRVRFHGADAS
ncbi:hypothetical protein M426DRAFT_15437 [Hypoxylon sp. CI-4A]|nr:hypothetical protein M426DRAFT_15437 [Hypoxylon sp. CI-4A]